MPTCSSSTTLDRVLERVLIGWDGGERAEDALALADALCRPGRSELVLARVLPRAVRGRGAELVAELTRTAGAVGASAECLPGDSVAAGLAELASELHADLVVVGSSCRGRIGQLLAGDVGVDLMHCSPCPVAIAPGGFRRRYAPGPRLIGVGFDGSPESRAALQSAVPLAIELAAELRLVGVVETDRLAGRAWPEPSLAIGEAVRPRRHQLTRELDEALAELPSSVFATGAVVSGDPARILADKCAAGFDLLVVGSRRRSTSARALLGSVSATLAHSLSCPMLLHPRGARTAEGARATTEYAA